VFPSHDRLIKKCPASDNWNGVPKSDAWIVWICDENTNIVDLQVYDLTLSIPHRREKILEFVNWRMREQKAIYRDIGCVVSDWNDWTLADVIFKLSVQYGFKNRETAEKCLRRLGYVDEFKDAIDKWLNRL